jgi:apolipoprotein N-acyltransferase
VNVSLFAHLLGLLTALGFPPFGIWPLAWIAGAGIVWVFLSHSERSQRKTLAWAFGHFSLALNLYGFYWVAYTLREFGALSWVAAILIYLLMIVALASVAFVFGWVWWRVLSWTHRGPLERVPRVVFLALWLALWNLVDLRAFPWTFAQSVGSDTLLLATVSVLDTWGWSLIFIVFVSVLGHWAWRSESLTRNFMIKIAALFVGVFAPLYALGFWRLNTFHEDFSARQPVVLLQGNVGNYQKRLTKLKVEPTVRNVMAIHRDLVEEAAIRFSEALDDNGEGPEPWVLWPETSFPGTPLHDVQAAEALKNLVGLSRGLHIVGAYEDGTIELAGKSKQVDFNIAALFHNKEGFVARYRKRIRVPFGEFIPGDQYFPQAYSWLPGVNHFGAGESFEALPHPDPQGPVFVPLICYEILFEGFVDDFVAEVRQRFPNREIVFVNLTNDSWYGPTSEPFQHSLLARWAAARKGLPMLRPTNTGLSQVVAPWGEVLATGPRDETWAIFGELPMRRTQPIRF